ncbi:MAG: ATP-binding cassette domain-containing protein, partial [Cyclobacteriaceae bacterium]
PATAIEKKISPIYYSQIVGEYLSSVRSKKITLTAKNLQFSYQHTGSGVHDINLSMHSGQLVGIMGSSGVGKSTLLNLLNGNLTPDQGEVLINGFGLDEERERLIGLIGFIPQDDLLIEELTVYQNLFFNARLCFRNYKIEEIKKLVQKTLTDLELYEVRNQKVGNPLKNYISGGQRKRLNIAMELIREPSILLVDEPTSGLSSKDSENVMDLLKEQTLKGKLVIVNIHQPSSNSFKLFDKLLVMDSGGLPVYFGDAVNAIIYFKSLSHQLDPSESECLRCGNIDTEQILEILETKSINEYGEYADERKVSPQLWHQYYKEKIEPGLSFIEEKKEIPANSFKKPGILKQFNIFTKRNLLSKISDTQYLLVSFFEAPLLAAILGFFTKYNSGNEVDSNAYIFSANENIPAYLFMSVVVALFLGLTMSAEEIIRDRRTLKRESFLSLSRAWYLNSKILFLFGMSAIQMFTYVLIGNWILGIKDLTFSYWLILFTTGCFANMLGLNISSAFKSVVTIYILIPFLLVPQLLFSGVIVKFDKLHSSVSSNHYVPIVGEIMTSRWAYEALAVNQYKNNKYQKYFFDIEKEESLATYLSSYLVPELHSILENCRRDILINKNKNEGQHNLDIIKEQLDLLSKKINVVDFSIDPMALSIDNFTSETYHKIKNDLLWIKNYYNNKLQESYAIKDRRITHLDEKMKNMPLYMVKENHYNSQLAELLLNKREINKIQLKKNTLIRKFEPIYHYPQSNYGRAHFYAPVKIIGGKEIDTFIFNIMVIWLFSIILYFTLLKDVLRKMITFSKINRTHLKKSYQNNKPLP